MNLSVGVVIPAYNAAAFVAEALESIEAQSRPPDRIVVVDDGSSDRTAAVVTEWAQDSPLALTLHRQENRGISAARNAGIYRLEGADLIALLDADDLWEPWHLESCVAALECYEDVVLCFADRQPIDASGPVGKSYFEKWGLPSVPISARGAGLQVLSGPIFQSLLQGSYVPTSTAVFRRDEAERIGFFDPAIRRCEDRDFFLRLSRIGRFGLFEKVHTLYRFHEDSVSHPANALSMQRGAYAVLTKLMEREDDLGLTVEEAAAVREAVYDQAVTLLYTASTRGVSAYLSNLVRVARTGIWRPTLNPKNAARAVLCSLPSYRARRQWSSR